MVQPVQHGYPDYGRYAALADVLQINVTHDAIAGFKAYPVRFVGNTDSIIVFANSATVNLNVSVIFYADQAQTVPLAVISMDMNTTSTLQQPIRVLGPFASVQVQVNGGANATVTLQVWNTNGLGIGHGNGQEPNLIGQNNAVVGAGANATFVANYVRAGELCWSMRTAAAAWSAKVQAVSFNGVTLDLDQVDQSLAGQLTSRRMFAPASIIQVVIHNGDAAPKNFDCWLSRQILLS